MTILFFPVEIEATTSNKFWHRFEGFGSFDNPQLQELLTKATQGLETRFGIKYTYKLL